MCLSVWAGASREPWLLGVTLERCAFAGVSPHEAYAYCMELECLSVCLSWPLRTYVPAKSGPFGVRRCTRLMHRATFLLWVSTVVALCAALIDGGAVGAKVGITVSAPAVVHWRASPGYALVGT